METSKKSVSKIRTIKESYGVTGIKLDLSLAHIYSLMTLRAECQCAIEDPTLDNRAKNLAKETKGVLDFIIGDIKSPYDPTLWQPEEVEKSEEFTRTRREEM